MEHPDLQVDGISFKVSHRNPRAEINEPLMRLDWEEDGTCNKGIAEISFNGTKWVQKISVSGPFCVDQDFADRVNAALRLGIESLGQDTVNKIAGKKSN